MFAYCLNNPVNGVDFHGNHSTKFAKCYVPILEESEESEPRDITEELDELMQRHVSELIDYYWTSLEKAAANHAYVGINAISIGDETIASFELMAYFIQKVRTNGEWDLKNNQYPYKQQFIYNGKTYSGEDIGNIHFGYVGAAVYSPAFLHFGAGVYQLYSGTRWEYWDTMFDEPQDSEMISYGIQLYYGR